MGCLAAQTNDQLDTKQEIQWVIRPATPETYLDQLVGRPIGPPPPPPPSEAALPSQPVLSSPETAPPVAHQPVLCQPVVRQPVLCQSVVHQPGRTVPPLLSLRLQPNLKACSLEPSHPRHSGMSTSVSRSARTY